MAKSTNKGEMDFLSLSKELDSFSECGSILSESPYAKITDFIPTGNYTLNALISADIYKGIPAGRVTIFSGESACLAPEQNVQVCLFHHAQHIQPDTFENQEDFNAYCSDNLTEKEIQNLVHDNPLGEWRVFIDSFDGFVEIKSYFIKAKKNIYRIETEDNFLLCADEHLIETELGWIYAKDLQIGTKVRTYNNYSDTITLCERVHQDIVYDFEIDHPNHRYFCAGFSNHNTGKTFLSLNTAAQAQKMGYKIIWLDSENAIDPDSVSNFGIDQSNFRHELVNTVSEVTTYVKKLTNLLLESKKKGLQIPKIMIFLDSLGNLSTDKEVNDSLSGSDKADMTRAKEIKKMFRVLTIEVAKLQIPMVVVNHTYASIGSFIPMQIQGGGCLTKNEKVLMENNKWKFINNIKIGDYVQTLNGPREVLATHKFNEKELVELELNNGRVIKCTPEHKFLVGITDNNEKIWKKAIDLNEEDEILAI